MLLVRASAEDCEAPSNACPRQELAIFDKWPKVGTASACEAAMTMNVNLSPQLEAMVKAKVASGRYTSASEVVREALRLMERQDQLKELQLEQLRQEIQNGLASGEPISWNPEAIKAEGRALLQAWAPSNQDD